MSANLKRRGSRQLLAVERLEDRLPLATFLVTNLSDGPVAAAGDAPGTLRQAIFNANQAPGPDSVVFQHDLAGTLSLVAGEIVVFEEVAVDGAAGGPVIIDAQGQSRIFVLWGFMLLVSAL